MQWAFTLGADTFIPGVHTQTQYSTCTESAKIKVVVGQLGVPDHYPYPS